jgi:hypothetical protein
VSAGLESVLACVWQQALIDKKKTVDLDGETDAVRQTSKSKRKQINFRFENRNLRGLEQNPSTKSRWAKLAREGKLVMQLLDKEKFTSTSQPFDAFEIYRASSCRSGYVFIIF